MYTKRENPASLDLYLSLSVAEKNEKKALCLQLK